MDEKTSLPTSVPAKIPKQAIITHIKSGGIYRVELTPQDGLRMEHSTEPAYAYRRLNGESPLWVRSQTEVEDGRFQIEPNLLDNSDTECQHLKTWPEYFKAVKLGVKTFEIRKKDRPFAVGTRLVLHEYDPNEKVFTGETLECIVTYMTDWEQKPGYVVMAINTIVETATEELGLEQITAERDDLDRRLHNVRSYVSKNMTGRFEGKDPHAPELNRLLNGFGPKPNPFQS